MSFYVADGAGEFWRDRWGQWVLTWQMGLVSFDMPDGASEFWHDRWVRWVLTWQMGQVSFDVTNGGGEFWHDRWGSEFWRDRWGQWVLTWQLMIKSCVEYISLSHALKNTTNQRPGLLLHILRYAMGNMQRVVFHSTFPSFLARNSLLVFIWGLPKSDLRNLSTPVNHYKHFRSHLKIVSEDFQRFSENFKRS